MVLSVSSFRKDLVLYKSPIFLLTEFVTWVRWPFQESDTYLQIFKWIYLTQQKYYWFWPWSVFFEILLLLPQSLTFGLVYMKSKFVFSEPDNNLFYFLCEPFGNLTYFLTLLFANMAVSSALRQFFTSYLFTWHFRSFTYKLYKRGPKIKPWLTPKRIGRMSNYSSPILQAWYRSRREGVAQYRIKQTGNWSQQQIRNISSII